MNAIELLKSLLKKCIIKQNTVDGFEKYTILDSRGSLFTVGFNKTAKKYGFGRSKIGREKLAIYGITDKNLPDYQSIYNVVKRQYQTEIVSYLFKEMINQSEINAFESQDADTYYTGNKIGRIFSITFDKKTKKYELKRSNMLKYLYDALDIPFDIEPQNTKELFDAAKAEYNWQVVRENVDSMYDFVPDYYDLPR